MWNKCCCSLITFPRVLLILVYCSSYWWSILLSLPSSSAAVLLLFCHWLDNTTPLGVIPARLPSLLPRVTLPRENTSLFDGCVCRITILLNYFPANHPVMKAQRCHFCFPSLARALATGNRNEVHRCVSN